jgi:hypothetical protein
VRSTAPCRPDAASGSRAPRAEAAAILLASLLLAACSGGNPIAHDAAGYEPTPQEPAPVDSSVDQGTMVDGAQCTAVIAQHPEEGFQHIACGSPTDYQTQPPSSGNHYSCWPEYRTFDVPVPWGNLVHALEHGAMIIVYNCGDAGCPDEVARAQSFIDTRPLDPSCAPDHRLILAPDPTLPVRWAATAWTWTLQADCFDDTAFGQFYTDHYGHGREVVCSGGAPYANLCDGTTCI